MEACLNPKTVTECHMPIAPAKRETKALAQLFELMARQPATAQRRAVLQSPEGERLELPVSIYKVLVAAVAAMVQGDSVSIVPVHQELTTQQAADLLHVSRPHLVQLLEEGEIPHHKTGSHRRIYVADLLRYRELRDAQRREALRELTRKSAEFGLEY